MKKSLITCALVSLLSAVTTSAEGINGTITGQCFACQNQDNYYRIARLSGDQAAFQKALMAGVFSGDCTLFYGGEKVSQTGGTFMPGLTKIRKPGEVQEYWVADFLVTNGWR